MREIKFRAWTNNCWINEGMLYNYQDTNYVEILGFNDDKLILMQFTGLKDKNGVDIYEGDILDNEYNAKGIVSFINGMFVVKFTYTETLLTKDNQTAFFRLYNVNMNTKRIGNIYENPELIMK